METRILDVHTRTFIEIARSALLANLNRVEGCAGTRNQGIAVLRVFKYRVPAYTYLPMICTIQVYVSGSRNYVFSHGRVQADR